MKNSQLRSLQVYGAYDAKAEGFLADGASLHICMSAHGPDADSWEKATRAELKPQKVDSTMAFMFESRYAMLLTRYAVEILRTATRLFPRLAGAEEAVAAVVLIAAKRRFPRGSLYPVSSRPHRERDGRG